MLKLARFSVIAVTILGLTAACSHDGSSQDDSTPVAAANGAHLLSVNDAVMAITDVWSLLTGIRKDNPMVRAWYVADENGDSPKVLAMLKQMTGGREAYSSTPVYTLPNGFQKVELHRTSETVPVTNKALNILSHGFCNGREHADSLASITEFSKAGEVCVSVDAVRQLSGKAAETETMFALVHQVAHMNGFDETDAKLLEQYFRDHWQAILDMNYESWMMTGGEPE